MKAMTDEEILSQARGEFHHNKPDPNFEELATQLKEIIDREPGNIIYILERNLTAMFLKGRDAAQAKQITMVDKFFLDHGFY